MCLTLHLARCVEGPVARSLNPRRERALGARLSSYLVATRWRGVRPAARATHSHWPVGASTSYSQDRLFHLRASAFHPHDPATAASRSGMWATLTRSRLPDCPYLQARFKNITVRAR